MENKTFDQEKVEFTYPEGFKKAAEALDFLPEEEREGALAGLAIGMLML